MTINGKPIAIKKVDAATVQFVAPDPYYALPDRAGLGVGHRAPRAVRPGRARRVRAGPLPEAVPPEVHGQGRRSTKKVAEVKFDSWVTLFKNRNDACRQPRPAGRDAVEDDLADQHAALGSWSGTRTASGWTPTATSSRTSTGSG